MGVRANVVLRRNGGNLITYGHALGEYLGRSVMREAFSPVFEFPLGLFRLAQGRREAALMNDVWCEGALLLDLDARRCVFFGGDGESYDHYWNVGLRADVMRLLRARLAVPRRSPWTIEWAEEGIGSIADAAGIPRSESAPRDAPVIRAAGEDHPVLARVTRITPDSSTSRGASIGTPVHRLGALGRGPAHLVERWDSLVPFDERWRASVTVVVDERTRELRVGQQAPRPLDFVRAAWPGWTVVAVTEGTCEPAELVRYLSSVVSVDGEPWLRRGLQRAECACGYVVGYGDDAASTETMLARLAGGAPTHMGIVADGDYLADHRHECAGVEEQVLAAYARAHVELVAREAGIDPDSERNSWALAAKLRREHHFAQAADDVLKTAEDALTELAEAR